MPPLQPSARALRSRAANVQIDMPDDSELFDLDNISGSDADDDPPVQRARHNRDHNEPTVAQIINNPDPKPLKVSTAADVHYYFEKIGIQNVCRECTYVFLLSPLIFSDIS